MANDIKRVMPDLALTSAGSVSTLDIPRDSVLKELSILFHIDVTVGTTAATGTVADPGWLAFVRRLEVVADGALTLWSIDPASLFMLDWCWYGAPGSRSAVPATITAGPFLAALRLPFALPFAADPNVTLLNAQALSSLQLRVTWGQVADVYQNANSSTFANTSLVSVETHEVIGLSPRSIFSAFKVSQISRDVSAANANLEIDLPRGNIMRGILVKSRITTNSVEDEVDTIVNLMRVESSELNRGLFVHRRETCTDVFGTGRPLSGYHVRNNMRYLYEINDLWTPFTGLHQNPSGEVPTVGFYQLEFMEDKRTSSALRTQPFSSLKLIMDCSSPSGSPNLTITTQEIIPAAPPRG
jgi:hypothetical protein